jgi:hypothetical protein
MRPKVGGGRLRGHSHDNTSHPITQSKPDPIIGEKELPFILGRNLAFLKF